MNKNRIDSLAITPSVPRQTPDNEFGSVLARTLGEAASKGASLIGSVASMSPVASAAVSSARAVTGLTAAGASHGVVAVGSSAGGVGTATAGGFAGSGLSNDASTAQLLQQISAGGDGSTSAYLELQMKMQAESQQFSAVSNIMKVRSDSAKAAINNIR